jgi:hypothetical protein
VSDVIIKKEAKMKKICVLGLIGIFFLLALPSPSSATISDPTGDNIGPMDLIIAGAEVYDRGDINLIKISINSAPHLPGVVIFECDVDNSTGTGGSMSTIGVPVFPCPCKTEPGFDVVVSIFTRQQGDSSVSAIAASCEDTQGPCGRRRESGEWYAVTSLGGQPVRAIGIVRGDIDPTPFAPVSGKTEDCYTLPWSYIIAYANQYQLETSPGDPKNFNYTKARANDYADGKWQVSIWYDDDAPSTDTDDIASGVFPTQVFDINDYAPNTGKADLEVSNGALDLTYCEGNFDYDWDQDGSDAAKFKANYGRTPFSFRCPHCGPHY